MRYLLDTSTFLWFIGEPQRLTHRVLDLIADSANEILLSHVSAWEIAVKVGAGKLRFDERLEDLLPREMQNHAFPGLAIQLRHVLSVGRLPLLHRDPFDRLLICQALGEDLPILSGDRAIAQYGVPVIW